MLEGLRELFRRAAAPVAARLPLPLARRMTFDSNWYHHNGYFKFAAGQAIETRKPCGEAPLWLVVVGPARGIMGEDAYLVRLPGGRPEIHYKWNIENLFR